MYFLGRHRKPLIILSNITHDSGIRVIYSQSCGFMGRWLIVFPVCFVLEKLFLKNKIDPLWKIPRFSMFGGLCLPTKTGL